MVTRTYAAAEARSVQALWRALEAEIGEVPIAASWDWVETWLRHYGDIVPSRFVAVEADGRVDGVALVTRGRSRRSRIFTIRTRHLGTAGEPEADSVCVEYNGLLVRPGQRAPFARALLETLRAEAGWDELRVDGFAPEEIQPFLEGGLFFDVKRSASPMTDLRRETGGAILTRLKSGTQAKIRRSLRGFGAVEEEWADTAEQAFDVLAELIALHQQRWNEAGQVGSFASARFTAFHRELIGKLLPKRAVVLFRGRAGGKTIGCLYSFVDRGRVLFYQSGFSSYEDSKLKPGLVLHALCMQRCADRGLVEYDFLAGEGRYKSELATGERTLIWAVHRRPGLRRSLESALRALRTRVLSPRV